MSNFESIAKILEGENGPVIAGIGGICFLVGCHYLTKSGYKIMAKDDKKSFMLGPAVVGQPAQDKEAK